MYDRTETTKIKQMRRQILTNLNMVYPSPLVLETLYRTVIGLDPMYDEQLFIKDAHYLIEKGWVVFVGDYFNATGTPFRKKIVKLTAKGKEIAEGTGTDQALEY